MGNRPTMGSPARGRSSLAGRRRRPATRDPPAASGSAIRRREAAGGSRPAVPPGRTRPAVSDPSKDRPAFAAGSARPGRALTCRPASALIRAREPAGGRFRPPAADPSWRAGTGQRRDRTLARPADRWRGGASGLRADRKAAGAATRPRPASGRWQNAGSGPSRPGASGRTRRAASGRNPVPRPAEADDRRPSVRTRLAASGRSPPAGTSRLAFLAPIPWCGRASARPPSAARARAGKPASGYCQPAAWDRQLAASDRSSGGTKARIAGCRPHRSARSGTGPCRRGASARTDDRTSATTACRPRLPSARSRCPETGRSRCSETGRSRRGASARTDDRTSATTAYRPWRPSDRSRRAASDRSPDAGTARSAGAAASRSSRAASDRCPHAASDRSPDAGTARSTRAASGRSRRGAPPGSGAGPRSQARRPAVRSRPAAAP